MTATNSTGRAKAPISKRLSTILPALSVYAFVSAGVLLLFEGLPPAVRIPIAIPLLLFVPGFAVTYVVFPPQEGRADALATTRQMGAPVTVLERTALAVVISIAIVPAIAYVLSPFVGISLAPVLLGIAIVTTVSSAGGIYRAAPGAQLGTAHTNTAEDSPGIRGWLSSLTDPLTFFAIFLSVVLIGTGAVIAMGGPDEHSPETEFYIDGEPETSTAQSSGISYDYELSLTQHGTETQEYTVVVMRGASESGTDSSGQATEVERFSTAVLPDETVTEQFEGAVSEGSAGTTHWFLLYTDDAPADPDRSSAHRVLQHTLNATG